MDAKERYDLAMKSYADGEHIPHEWKADYDEGEGCWPGGWYLRGYQKHGMPCCFPIRHEYGPFETEAEAWAYRELVDADMARVTREKKVKSDWDV